MWPVPCGVADILSLILEDRLAAAGRLSDGRELDRLVVSVAALKAALPQGPGTDRSFSDACRALVLSYRSRPPAGATGFVESPRGRDAAGSAHVGHFAQNDWDRTRRRHRSLASAAIWISGHSGLSHVKPLRSAIRMGLRPSHYETIFVAA